MPGAMRWISDRFEQKIPPQGCKTMDMSTESVKGARQGLTFTGMLGVGMASLGLPVGPNVLVNWITKFPD